MKLTQNKSTSRRYIRCPSNQKIPSKSMNNFLIISALGGLCFFKSYLPFKRLFKETFPPSFFFWKRENYHRPSGGMVVHRGSLSFKKKMNNSVIIIKKEVESNSSALISHASVDTTYLVLFPRSGNEICLNPKPAVYVTRWTVVDLKWKLMPIDRSLDALQLWFWVLSDET